MLDNEVLEDFRARAAEQGTGYQTAINLAPRESLSRRPIDEETLRRVLREELHVAAAIEASLRLDAYRYRSRGLLGITPISIDTPYFARVLAFGPVLHSLLIGAFLAFLVSIHQITADQPRGGTDPGPKRRIARDGPDRSPRSRASYRARHGPLLSIGHARAAHQRPGE